MTSCGISTCASEATRPRPLRAGYCQQYFQFAPCHGMHSSINHQLASPDANLACVICHITRRRMLLCDACGTGCYIECIHKEMRKRTCILGASPLRCVCINLTSAWDERDSCHTPWLKRNVTDAALSCWYVCCLAKFNLITYDLPYSKRNNCSINRSQKVPENSKRVSSVRYEVSSKFKDVIDRTFPVVSNKLLETDHQNHPEASISMFGRRLVMC